MGVAVDEARKGKAEVCYGDKICREKFGSWLTGIGIPHSLLSFQEIEECGYVKDTGFVWLKHKKRKKGRDRECSFRFEKVNVWFEDEITAYFEPNRIKNLTGVKAKEFWISIWVTEIQVNQFSSYSSSATGLITFRTISGLSKSFPLSLFEVRTVGQFPMMKQTDHDAGGEGQKMVKTK